MAKAKGAAQPKFKENAKRMKKGEPLKTKGGKSVQAKHRKS